MQIRMDDGTALEVEVTGQGPALVLVHGHGGAKEDFDDQVAPLARHHTVVRPDLRGHGESDKPSDAQHYSLGRLVADLHDLFDALELESARLLGHSMGGMVARRFVLEHPERVDAMIFMDTCGGPVDGWDPAVIEIAARTALEEGKAATKELMDAFSPLNNQVYERLLRDRPGYQEFMDAKWEAVSIVAWGSLLRSIAYQPDDHPALAELRCPTLVIVGEQDESFVEPSRRLAATIPGAVLCEIPDAAHSPQLENPKLWLTAVETFLAGVDGRAALR